MKKYTTPDVEITAILSADIITGSLTVGSGENVFANQNINISTDLDFSGSDINF